MVLVGERVYEGMNPNNLAPGVIVQLESRQARNISEHTYERQCVAVGDESDPKERKILNDDFDMWEAEILLNDEQWPVPHRRNNYETNPAMEYFYNKFPALGSMREWFTLVPSARALYPMQRLHDAARVFPDHKEVDAWAMNIFKNAIDSIALRSRARIMKQIELRIAERSSEQELVIVSLGCGAAVPVLDAVVAMRDQYGKSAHVSLYDQDKDVLDFAEELAGEEDISIPEKDRHVGSYTEAFKLPPESVDIVDALGLWEYLPDKRCRELLADAYVLLKPGGSIIVSNMLSSRRQLEFNRRAIGWPGVKPRSEDQLVDIVHDAGIDTSLLTFTTSEDGVYAVMEIRKPL